ncbi:hypothetical protein ACFIJ5_05600 [Haloimpatiens sp. FM7330]|uniref:hypothetical protein n=1 Tax=Haloimpatiens sp. FM7330 TaxID=3298610 RepID=UPI00363C0E51
MNIFFSPQHRIYSANLSYSSNANSPKNDLNNTGKIRRCKTMKKTSGRKLKPNNILKNLMKQKENLMNHKDNLMKRCLEKGEDPKTIKEKLENIDKQIEEIDKQLNKLQLKEQRKTISGDNKNKKSKNSKQKLDKNHPNGIKTNPSMNNILSLSNNLKKAEALLSEKKLISVNAKVLDFEIKIDLKRGINPVAKKKSLAKMKDSIKKITEKLGNHLKDVNTKIINNTQNNSSNDIVGKNEQSSNTAISGKPKDVDRMFIRQQQAAQNIKNYKDNLKDTVKDNGKEINIIA